jgi:hypothetical protein
VADIPLSGSMHLLRASQHVEHHGNHVIPDAQSDVATSLGALPGLAPGSFKIHIMRMMSLLAGGTGIGFVMALNRGS